MTLDVLSAKLRHRRLTTPRGPAEVWLERHGTQVSLHTSQPNGGGSSNWKRCSEEHCLGEAISAGRCFAHSSPLERTAYVAKQQSSQGWLSLRGVVADESVLASVFGSGRLSGVRFPHLVSLAGAEINAPLRFENVDFQRDLDVHGATLSASMSFRRCRFRAGVNAGFAFFNAGAPSWVECEIERDVRLGYAHAERVSVGLEGCTIHGEFVADGISGALLLRQCVFKKGVSISNAATTLVSLDGSSVDQGVALTDSVLEGFHAQETRFPSAHQLGPFSAKFCYLQRASFGARTRLELASHELVLDGAQFASGGTVLLNGGEVSLQQVSVGRQLRVAGKTSGAAIPQVRSLRDSDAGSMSFARVSLEHCLFYGAHSLGTITLDSSVLLARAPTRLHAARRCIADEVHWRASRAGLAGYFWKARLRALTEREKDREATRIPSEPSPSPAQIAALYRELRRSLEGRADQPGASDFYYGEMEMRRADETAALSDRIVVSAYWLASGYGLLVSRAFALLVALVAGATLALQRFGFADGPTTVASATVFSLRAVLPGMRRTHPTLTVLGDFVEIGTGIVGPALLALLLLALRGRVRR